MVYGYGQTHPPNRLHVFLFAWLHASELPPGPGGSKLGTPLGPVSGCRWQASPTQVCPSRQSALLAQILSESPEHVPVPGMQLPGCRKGLPPLLMQSMIGMQLATNSLLSLQALSHAVNAVKIVDGQAPPVDRAQLRANASSCLANCSCCVPLTLTHSPSNADPQWFRSVLFTSTPQTFKPVPKTA